MEKTDPDCIFPDACMKNILKHVRFDQRAFLALHISYLHSIDSSVPLRLDYFHFEDLTTVIDTACYDFYEFWNFPIPSPSSKKEVDRIRNQKHFGNLFFRKVDLSGRWEKKVPIGITQGKGEEILINCLIERFEKVYIRRLKIDDVEDFLMRIGQERWGKIIVVDLHAKIQNYEEFIKICDFLNPESFPLKKLEIEIENLDEMDLSYDKINTMMKLRVKVAPDTRSQKAVGFVYRFLEQNPQSCSNLTLEVQDEMFILAIFTFLQEKYNVKKIPFGERFTLRFDQNPVLIVFGGQVKQYKNHIYDILGKSYSWIFSLTILHP